MIAGFPVAGYLLVPESAHLRLLAAVGLWLICTCAIVFYRRKRQVEEFEKDIINVLGLISRAASLWVIYPTSD
ncbi:hypothetical protein OH492_14270 [Vibrio chagasii]|nr:hypothetical protein [Vibrio chagasii]